MYAKDINWRGSTLDDLITFPQAIRRIAGFELHKVQHGREPTDWKPINEWGMGVIEIRLHGEVARFSDVVCVLHCFQKKTQKTSQRDIAIIKARYKAARDEWREKK